MGEKEFVENCRKFNCAKNHGLGGIKASEKEIKSFARNAKGSFAESKQSSLSKKDPVHDAM